MVVIGHSADFVDAYLTEYLAAPIAHFSRKPHDSQANRANSFLDQLLLGLVFDHDLVLIKGDFFQSSVEILRKVVVYPDFDILFVNFVELLEELLILKVHFLLN